jgi:excisionase family DNA binding protein
MDKKINNLIPNQKFFRTEEVAALFDVSIRSVYRWIEEGKLAALKMKNGQFRVARQNLIDFLQ